MFFAKGNARSRYPTTTYSNSASRSNLRSAALHCFAFPHLPTSSFPSSSSPTHNLNVLMTMSMTNTSLDEFISTPHPLQNTSWTTGTMGQAYSETGGTQFTGFQTPPIWPGDGHRTGQEHAPTGAGAVTQERYPLDHPAPLEDQPNYCPNYETSPSLDLISVPSFSHSPSSSASTLSPHTPIIDFYIDNKQWITPPHTDFPGLFLGDSHLQIDAALREDHEEFSNTYPGVQRDSPCGGVGFQEEAGGYRRSQLMQPGPNSRQIGFSRPTVLEADTFRPFLSFTEEEVYQHVALFKAFRAQQEALNTQMGTVDPQIFPDVSLNKKRRVNPQQSYAGTEYLRYCVMKKDSSLREAEAEAFPMPNLQSQAFVGDHCPSYDPSFVSPLIEAAPDAGPSSIKRTRIDFEGDLEAVNLPEHTNDNTVGHEHHTKNSNVKSEKILCRWNSCLTPVSNTQAALTAHFNACHSEYMNAEPRIKCVWAGCTSKKPILKGQFTRHILHTVGHAVSLNPADTTGQPKRYRCGIGACTANPTTASSLKRHKKTCKGQAK